MILEIEFEEDCETLNVEFGEVQDVSDGGYERGLAEGESIGYEKGHAEGVTEGYDNGYAEGETDGYGKGYVTGETNGYNNGYNSGYVIGEEAGYQNGLSTGQQLEREEFWDNIFTSLNGNFTNAFSARAWTDETYNPTQDIVCSKVSAVSVFNSSQITDTKVRVEVRVSSANTMFTGCSNLKTIPYLGFFGVTSNSSIFTSCANLENITFGGEIQVALSISAASKLTNESVQSIIDHLADLTGKTSAKISFHSTVISKLTQEQINAIGAKNWTF